MYSKSAVKCCFKTINEVMCQRIYGALSRLSYGAVICIKVAPVGFEPTTSGSLGMYSNSAVDRCIGGDEEFEQIHFQVGVEPTST